MSLDLPAPPVSLDDSVGPGGPDLMHSRPGRRVPANTALGAVVLLAVVGFALIGLTWARVSELTNTAKQFPYIVSGGLTGLGLVVLAASALVVVTRRPDDQVRHEQTEALIAALERIDAALGDDRG